MEFGLGLGNFTIIDDKGTEVEVGKMLSTESYNKIVDLLSQLQAELGSIASEEEQKVEWFDTSDELVIECTELDDSRIEIECNYKSWSLVKSDIEKYEHMLLLEVCEGDYKKSTVGVTLEQMKLLRDYLNHKIDYIEN